MRASRALIAFAALTAGPAAAQGLGGPWEQQVRRQLARAGATLRRDGYTRSDASEIRALNADESEAFILTLERGATYALLGVCDHDCTGLSLVLFNEVGYEVAADRATNEAPVLQVTPRERGRYRVKVVMAGCRMNPCWYGLGLYARPR